MSINDWEDDDWETNDVPDLLVSLQNKEDELKKLAERRMVEDADLELSEDLFSENKKSVLNDFPKEQLTKEKEKEKKPSFKNKKNIELQDKQKEKAQQKRLKKQQAQQHKELYGDAELDEYDELYGDIEELYC